MGFWPGGREDVVSSPLVVCGVGVGEQLAGQLVPEDESELSRSSGAPVGRVLASGDEGASELPAALAVTALAVG